MRGRAAVGLVLALGACRQARAPKDDPRVVVAWPQGAASLMPDAGDEEFTIAVQRNVYDSLLETNGDGSLRPALAQSWENPDDRTWILKLRKDVHLHDGRRLEASQVLVCLGRAWTREGSGAAVPAGISFEAPTPETVAIRTQEPFALLALRLASLLIWVPPAGSSGFPVGTGPYRVSRFRPGETAVLEAFDAHWRGAPQVTHLEFRAVPNAADRLRLLRRGEVQLVPDVPADEFDALRFEPGLKAFSRRGLRMVFLGMAGDRPPFRDPSVRRAVRASRPISPPRGFRCSRAANRTRPGTRAAVAAR